MLPFAFIFNPMPLLSFTNSSLKSDIDVYMQSKYSLLTFSFMIFSNNDLQVPQMLVLDVSTRRLLT